jgi:Gpi18-like mannosyltransferase
LALGLIIRMYLARDPGHEADLRTLEDFSLDLARGGPFNFYEGPNFKDYLPGYLYYLWGIGLAGKWIGFGHDTTFWLLKFPSIFADLASCLLLYVILEEKPMRVRLLSALTYALLPTALFIGPIWGQVDSLLALSILGVIYLLNKQRMVSAAVLFTVAFMIKPQAIAMLPFLAFWGLRDSTPIVWARCVGAAFVTAMIIMLPFFSYEPWNIFQQLYDATNVFVFTSSFAYNFWGMFGWFRDDNVTTFFISWRMWGLIFTVVSQFFIIYSLRNARGVGMLCFGVALTALAFFVFQTRMHERYMFSMLLPLLAACFYLNKPVLWISFVSLSLMQFLMLYAAFFHPFFNDNHPAWLHAEWMLRMLNYSPSWWHRASTFQVFLSSLFVTLNLLVLMAYAFLSQHRIVPVAEDDELRLGRPNVLG